MRFSLKTGALCVAAVRFARRGLFWAALLALPACFSPARASDMTEAAPALTATGARIAGDRIRTRVVFDFDRAFPFSTHYVTRPDRLVIDLPATAFSFSADTVKGAGLFQEIRFGTMDEASARIVLTASKPVRLLSSEVVTDDGGKGARLVLEAESVSAAEYAKLVAEQSWTASGKGSRLAAAPENAAPSAPDKFVVAVDAGHGGIDAGATGSSSGVVEKEITLAAARVLVERLNREDGVQAILTRSSDKFLSLSERVNIARRHEARLFISLHADMLKQKDIRGATVYTISDKASDRMAGDLAARENLSDELAGISLQDAPSGVADILLDLTRRETQAFSIAMARTVVSSFEGQVGLINNPHRHAGFRVLQAHDIPSVLLELGFLSNPEDEKLLLDEAWRVKVADLLAAAVSRYRAAAQPNGG